MIAVQERITARVLAAVTKGTEIVMNAAKERAPVGETGDLQAGIVMEVELQGQQVTGQVVSTSDHGGFVEFGTGLRGRGTYPYDLPTEGIPYTGGWVYDYKEQDWKGHAAQPYLRNSLDESAGAIMDAFREQGFNV